jgi:hypothetical protein
MDKYRQKTQKAWNELQQKQVDPDNIGVSA